MAKPSLYSCLTATYTIIIIIVCSSLPKRTILSHVSGGMLSEVAEQADLKLKTSITVRTWERWLIVG